jgi:hypothetical protein
MNSSKDHINDMTYNRKNTLSLKDDLDKIIEREYEKAFEILDEYIEYIKREYGIDYIKPKLRIVDNKSSLVWVYLSALDKFIGRYIGDFNIITFSKKLIKRFINMQLKFLSNKKGIEEIINRRLKFFGYKEIKVSISDVQDIRYLYMLQNLMFLYPSYINEKNKRESIAEFITLLTTLHEGYHSIDFSILDKLEKDPTIKDREYLLTILNDHDNIELRASAFEVVMYYLASGLYKDERGYIAAYANIPICRTYIEKMDILEKNKNTKEYVPYDLGLCYGNVIVAKYGPSLKENIYKIIDDIIHLDKERAIEVIKYYGDNPDKLLHD